MQLTFKRPTLVTITAPTCAGKNFLLEGMISELGFERIVSTTDRQPRAGEIEGVHYNFISTEQSKKLEEQSQLAELVTYNGVRYGVTHEEMAYKMVAGAKPPIVILEPQGLEVYKKYCMLHRWGIFSVFVQTPEPIRLARLAARTTTDLMSALQDVTGVTQEDATLNARSTIAKVIDANNRRLHAIIQQERAWPNSHKWDVLVPGTNLQMALDHIAHAVQNRNKRDDIYA